MRKESQELVSGLIPETLLLSGFKVYWEEKKRSSVEVVLQEIKY